MVLISAVRDYINRMLQDISGMKVLILDSHTVSIVSVGYSQSELLQKEVFLVELVDSIYKSKEPMSHLKAVYFLRPTSENIQHLRQQLASPRFGEYHLFFSNILKDTQIHNLADADEQEVVQQIQEFYADFVAIDPYHFTLNMPSNHIYMLPAVVDPSNSQHFCDRVVDGIASIFLALKRRPIIRYQRNSDIAKRIAQETAKLMYQQESGLFDFRRMEVSPLLLVIDRRDDPVTPLLNQWTYQAMVHELIGIQDNKVDLRNIGKLPKDQQEVVLSSEQDAFFKANMYENFGDIGMNIKRLVDEFQQISKSNQSIQTIGSECLLNNESVSDIDRLRLVMLYALRYEKESPEFILFVYRKRFWAIPDPDKLDEEASAVEKHKSRALNPTDDCENKDAIVRTGDIVSQVSQTHDVIMTLDKTISSLEMQLAAARAAKVNDDEGSPVVTNSGSEQFKDRPKVFFVMGIITAFSSRKRRDSIRETWMPQGEELRKLEKEKGIIMRFVIGHRNLRTRLNKSRKSKSDEPKFH